MAFPPAKKKGNLPPWLAKAAARKLAKHPKPGTPVGAKKGVPPTAKKSATNVPVGKPAAPKGMPPAFVAAMQKRMAGKK